MARPLRIAFPNAFYHVTTRGNRQEKIFADDIDRQQWLTVLAGVCQRMGWLCYAYCLMDNHYHLVIETVRPTLIQGMRQLNGVYTQNFNRRHQRTGHVFQGRYKAIIIDKDNYLLEVCRYTVLNPVRAGMVAKAGDWTWSSFPATSGMVDAPAWLEVEQLLTLFGRNQQLAQAAYRSFVRQVVASPPLWDALQGQIYLGDQRFVRRLQAMAGTDHQLSEIPRLQRTPPPKPLAHFSECYPDRRRAMAEAFHSGQYTMKEIAHFHGVHYSTVSRWIKHFEQEPAAVD